MDKMHERTVRGGLLVRYVRCKSRDFGHVYLIVPNGNEKPYGPDMSVIKRYPVREGDVVADIGAYVGTYSMFAASSGAARVLAYEPGPRQLVVLRKNVARFLQVEVRPVIVAARSRRAVAFYPGRHGINDSMIPSRVRSKPVTVQSVSYEEAVASATVIKVDVEGAEHGIELWRVPEQTRLVLVDFHTRRGWEPKVNRARDGMLRQGFQEARSPDFTARFSTTVVWMRQ